MARWIARRPENRDDRSGDVGADDPEPEFVGERRGEIVVTLQENNEIVLIGADGVVSGHFSAGSGT